jgi:aminoglycoside phosphotransferase (APT) family kinase protein
MSEGLEVKLQDYVAHRIPEATSVEVSGLDRIHGGASRETFRFVLSYRDGEAAVERRLILRRDPAGSLIETDRRVEFEAYRAFAEVEGVPVPEVFWLEASERWLGAPFFIMQEITGFQAGPVEISMPPFAEHAASYGRALWEILGRISGADPEALGLVEILGAMEPEEVWERQLDHWAATLERREVTPQPITWAAVRWLRRNPPPPPERLAVVHGDYRTGNFLYDEVGGIHGILDWEMAHLGDPLEDLAWSFSPIFDFMRSGRAGGLLPRDQAIAIWEASSGRKLDRRAFNWWEVFTCVKGQTIWVSSAHEFLEGENRDPILAMASLGQVTRQDRSTLEALGKMR